MAKLTPATLIAVMSFFASIAFEVSGYQSVSVAVALWSLSGILGSVAVYKHFAKVRAIFPIHALIRLLYICFGSLLILAAFGYLQRLRSTPYDPVILAVIFCASVLILYLWTARAPQRITTPTMTAELENTRPDPSLLEYAEHDKGDISKCVLITEHEIDYEGLKDEVQYLYFIFTIFNGSVYRISIDKEIDGFIYFHQKALSSKPQLFKNYVENYPHGESERLIIRQVVNEKEAALILNASTSDEFSFSHVIITVRGNYDFPDVKPQPLSLPSTIHAQQRVKLIDRIKELEDGKTKLVERHKTEVARLQELAQTHSIRADMRDSERKAFQWLYDIVDTQKDRIDEFVILEKCTLGDMVLDRSKPSVRFGLSITNHSVFDITIEVEQGDSILFVGERLDTYPMKILYNDLIDAPCGKEGAVTIEQPLSKEEAEHIAKSVDSADANFYFDGLVITIKGGQRCSQVVEKRLVITKGVHISGGPLTFGVGDVPDIGDKEKGKRKLLREQLQEILNHGYNVALIGRDTVYESEVDQYNRWHAKAEGFVRIYRDESDVKRFQQGGLPVLEEFLKDYLD